MTRSQALASLRRSYAIFYRKGQVGSCDMAMSVRMKLLDSRLASPEFLNIAAQLEQRAERFSV